MNEKVEKLIKKAQIIINGKTMYKAEIVKEINDFGAYLHFTNEGIRYNF